MKQIILLLLPTLVFTIVTIVSLLGVWIWSRYFARRNQDIKEHIATIASLRQSPKNELLRTDQENLPPLLEWLSKKIGNNNGLQLLIIRSGSSKSPIEIVLISIGLFLVGSLLSRLFGFTDLLTTLSLSLACLGSPWFYLNQKAKKRRMKFEDQLPEALDFISRSLRAGHGLVISMGMVVGELPDPVSAEFKITFEELNFGIPFQDAMANMMVRVNSPDLTFFTVAVSIQRETGGNLTELLAGLAKTIRERVKLKGKVRILASEGKFSGYLLGVLPFLMALVLTLSNPSFMEPLWYTPQGHDLIAISLVMMLLGALWMRAIVQIKV